MSILNPQQAGAKITETKVAVDLLLKELSALGLLKAL
jgi:hypothetical protein